MPTSAIKVCSKKKGKARGPSELENILLGYYIRLGPECQEPCIYFGIKSLQYDKRINRNFGIKSFLSQNCGGMCLHQNLERETQELEAPQNCVDQGIDCIRIDIS